MGKKYYILVHLGAWSIMVLPAFILMFEGHEGFHNDRFIIFLFNTLFTILNFYLFYSLLIPQLYDKNKIILLISLTILFLVFYPILQLHIFSFLRDHVNITWKRLKFKDYFLSQAYTTAFLYTGLAYLARFTIKFVFEKQKQAELINQNQTSELALLRSQINPHFLFNTLNNIYSLVLKKSDDAPEAMMKLSEIMRYMLYETNTEKVPLEKEISYLESYIELMKLRLKQENFVSFKITGEPTKHEIAPMLLVPFVENAFKHGNKKVESPGIIINLDVNPEIIVFKVVNFIKDDCMDELNTSGGIGLNNIKRRLELLYPKRYHLEINQPDDKYVIILQLHY